MTRKESVRRICFPKRAIEQATKLQMFIAEAPAVERAQTSTTSPALEGGQDFLRAIDCTVRNLSETGAALEVTTPVGIPERFTLVIEADQRQVQCHLVWRKERRIGVLFVRT
jgi:hypothetical protein